MNARRLVTMAALGVSLTAGAAAAPASASIRLDPKSLTLHPGQSGDVRVWVDGVTELAGAEVHLTYDPGIVEVVDADPESEGVQVEHGEFLSADFVAVNQASSDERSIDYAVARMPPHEPASGSGVLATVTLRGVEPGETTLVATKVLLADPDGYPIPAVMQRATTTVTVSAGRSVPDVCWSFGAVILLVATYAAIGRRPRPVRGIARRESVR